MIEFKLPALGADMDEGRLLAWNVAPGQAVKKGDVVAVVDTTKAAIDVEIWQDGVVQQLVTEVGQTIPVGTVMALLRAPGEPAAAAPVAAPVVPPVGAAVPEIVHAVAATAPAPGPARELPALDEARARVSPAARQRAAALGVRLAGLAGSGAGGAVTMSDVERAAMQATPLAAAAPTPVAAPAGAPVAALSPLDRAAEMRKSIAAAMSRSKREIPHYYLAETVPMRRALDWLAAANAERAVTARLLPAVLLLKAVALAVRDFPEMNGLYLDGSYRPAALAHIGVAISLRRGGLVAPALHDVGSKSPDLLMAQLADLVKRCRAGSLRSSELADPTITVTNLGDQGVEAVYGVIYPPQVALVGFGRTGLRPGVDDQGGVLALPMLTASLAADHRVSDGHRGALFLACLRDWLQRPDELQGERP